MIICIGPVCVPIWHIWIVLAFLFKPIWNFVKIHIFRYKQNNDEEKFCSVAEDNSANGQFMGLIATMKDWDHVVDIAAQKNFPVIIKYSADFCTPCKLIAPAFKALATQIDGLFCEVDVENSLTESLSHNVSSLPTFEILKINLETKTWTVEASFIGADLSPLHKYFRKSK